MATTLAELANLVGGKLIGDGSIELTGAATLDAAGPGDISLADRADRARDLQQSAAAAAIVAEDVEPGAKPAVVVADVHEAFTLVVRHFRPQRIAARTGISRRANVSGTARIASDAEIHAGATVGEDVVVGEGSTIHAGVRLLPGCRVGRDVTIFPNAVLYENTRVGDRVIIHASAVLGAYGFGYKQTEGRHVLSAQLGYVEIQDDVEIGASTTIDRGTYGPTVIGAGTKIDNQVMIAHNCRLGRHNLICSQVGIAGSTTTGDYVVMAGQVGVRDHVHVGERAVICSQAGVANHVPPDTEMLGSPATTLRQQKLQFAAVAKLPDMRREFRRLQRELQELQSRLNLPDPASSPAAKDRAA